MHMKGRIAVLALAVGFLAAPTLGAVAMDSCPPCCPQPADAPCETGQTPCEFLAATPCCDAAPAAPSSPAKRSLDGPGFQLVAAGIRSSAPPQQPVLPPRVAGDLAVLTSPLRLSVVLLI